MGATYKDSYYTLVSGNTWQEAEANAVNLGGHLYVANDLGEYQFIKDLMWANANDWGSNYTWVGYKSTGGLVSNGSDGRIIHSDGSIYQFNGGQTYEAYLLGPDAYEIKDGEIIKDKTQYLAIATAGFMRYGTEEFWADYNKKFGWGPTQGIAEIPLSVYATNADKSKLSYFSIDDAAVKEGETAKLTITRSGNTSGSTTVTVKSSPTTANTGTNFYDIWTQLTFLPNETSKTIEARTINTHSYPPGDKQFIVTLTDQDANVVFSKSVGCVTIYDSSKIITSQTSSTDQNSTNTSPTINKDPLSREQLIFLSSDDAIKSWFPSPQAITKIETPKDDAYINVTASTWTEKVKISSVSAIGEEGGKVELPQIDLVSGIVQGSVVEGSKKDDVIMGKAGWDVIDAGDGNDLVHGGNGRDIITGGDGSDELWGDFGWNTYKNSKDRSQDLVAIKSDQWLVNWMYGQAGNNPNGEKADIIEVLDSNDQIKIVGCDTKDLTFQANATAHGVSGIGIYAKGALEAVYTGGDLSVGQIQAMTSGDGSSMAMNNNINSYGWTQNPGTLVAT